jgi:hypothetical protein
LAVYDHLNANKKIWCESCGEQGHKHYECPERLFGNTALIYCQTCGSNNHPSNDCPLKSNCLIFFYKLILILEKDKKKGEVEDITPEEELHNFLQDLKREKEVKEKYKALTGKEAPRELTYQQYEAMTGVTKVSDQPLSIEAAQPED